MVWREPRNHVSDCYFCAIDVTGINRKNCKILKYPDLESARRPVAHSDECTVPVYAMLFEDSDNGSTASQESQEDEEADFSDDTPHQWRPVPVLNGGAAIDIVIYCFCRNFSREQSLKVNKP